MVKPRAWLQETARAIWCSVRAKRVLSALGFAAFFSGGLAPDALAGGFTLPEGQGQIIAGVGYIAAPRTFDRSGRAIVAPAYNKAVVTAYLEYGATDWLTAIVAPSVARMQAGAPDKTYTGSDESAVGARLRLFGDRTGAFALQVLIEPPLGAHRDAMAEARFGGPNVAAVDVRLQYARVFTLFGLPSFAALEPGARLRDQGWPDEARLDLTFGIRPSARTLILLQNFNSFAHSAGPLLPQTGYTKAELSVVYDLSAAWAAQVGVIRTLAGRNAAREFGPFGALWYRF